MDVRTTSEFEDWLSSLADDKASAIITARILRVKSGLLGDVKSVGDGVSELRIDYGPGYRVYFARQGTDFVVLLCGGDKTTQSSDIKKAKALAAGLKAEKKAKQSK